MLMLLISVLVLSAAGDLPRRPEDSRNNYKDAMTTEGICPLCSVLQKRHGDKEDLKRLCEMACKS